MSFEGSRAMVHNRDVPGSNFYRKSVTLWFVLVARDKHDNTAYFSHLSNSSFTYTLQLD